MGKRGKHSNKMVQGKGTVHACGRPQGDREYVRVRGQRRGCDGTLPIAAYLLAPSPGRHELCDLISSEVRA